jgi:hypothetical protein
MVDSVDRWLQFDLRKNDFEPVDCCANLVGGRRQWQREPAADSTQAEAISDNRIALHNVRIRSSRDAGAVSGVRIRRARRAT